MEQETMDTPKKRTRLLESVILFLKGIVVGVANIIPGVSGGTIAVIVGVFDRLVEAVNTLFKKFKSNMLFLIPLGLGAAAGIVGLSRLIGFCLEEYPIQTNFFFVGLVAGSIPLIYKKAAHRNGNGEESPKSHFSPLYIIPFVLGAAAVIVLAIVQTYVIKDSGGEAAVSAMSAAAFFQYLFGGAIASIAMVVPGISGSLVMVLIGLYDKVLGVIAGLTHFSDKDLFIHSLLCAIPIGLGILIGIFTVAKLIEFLMKRYHQATYFAIFGLMTGSLAALLISMELYAVSFTVLMICISAVTAAVGFFTAYFLGRE